MAVYKLFSDRERMRLRGKEPDVLTYDLPDKLRRQIVLIWLEAIGQYVVPAPYSAPATGTFAWRNISNLLRKETGVFQLAVGLTPDLEVGNYFLNAGDDKDALSVVEVVFREIDELIHAHQIEDRDSAAELNERFRQHAVGYQFESGTIVRMDTIYSHDEIVKPALLLLSQPGFEGANAEFLQAHEDYRKGKQSAAINEALKSFESTMKCICKQRKIPADPKWAAKDLITCMFDNAVLPKQLESHFGGLRSALESGLPTVRNQKGAAHGQGQKVVNLPEHLVRHALHLAAANIVLLVESHLATQ